MIRSVELAVPAKVLEELARDGQRYKDPKCRVGRPGQGLEELARDGQRYNDPKCRVGRPGQGFGGIGQGRPTLQ